MTTSPRWRSVAASAAAAAALFTAPLAGAATAHADGNHPYPPHPTHTPYPPYPPKPPRHHGDNDCDEYGQDGHGPDKDGCDDGCDDHDHVCDIDDQHLAHTGADHTKEVILSSAAAALIAAGAGTILIVRRRSNS
ncbi:hypothetical protein GCM10010339_55480 [Streptomyces alanosinicus]|uniref:Gram-positive cocci surface proteins LPxTG domain-containing protein n=2 Tax=Streptomyces alanosinicus TaxID=68171 RepID=A0A919D671_9ACTN|nr:hypothetical protein GCM10010339_55480 [Streptomyces alanosinicus]